MHGLGNDYLYIYTTDVPENVAELAMKYSDRHFGVGSDGLIFILPSECADFKMRIFNADGSEANMCGNGIRCVGKYVYDRGHTTKTDVRIDTLSGVKTLHLTLDESRPAGDKVALVSVDMGRATVSEVQDVEVTCGLAYDAAAEEFVAAGGGAGGAGGASAAGGAGGAGGASAAGGANAVGGEAAGAAASSAAAAASSSSAPARVPVVPVSVGNPHAVTFVKDAEAVPLTEIGPAIEKNAAFPGGVNAEFIQVIGPQELRMRVWERGSGITWACGTGSCASVAAAIHRGLCKSGAPVTVHLDGGDLIINIDAQNNVNMTGPATFVCNGETL